MKSSFESNEARPQFSVKRDIGFAISVLGFGLTLLFAFYFVARPGPGSGLRLDGVEQYVEEIGHGFQSIVIIACATAVMVVFGGIGLALGSRLGKSLFVVGMVAAMLLAIVFLYAIFSR
ncbi:membrane protein [Rhodopirellula europaea 6C]|uniref:Membrane protein n=1 Tax=Rhodopirellula europaea 6C TaxID=1263867 RepID=M2AUZ2_9BACT|nr:membrane protein [Rhodopirellula europaea 6C]